MSEDLKVWRIVGVLNRKLNAYRKNPDGSKTLLASHDDLDVLCHGDHPLDCKQRLAEIARDWSREKWREFKSARLEFFWSNGWGEPSKKRYTREMLRVNLESIRIGIVREKMGKSPETVTRIKQLRRQREREAS